MPLSAEQRLAIAAEYRNFPALPASENRLLLWLLNAFVSLQRLFRRAASDTPHERHRIPRADGSSLALIGIATRTAGPSAPALLYYHGGAFFLGYAGIHLANAEQLARETGCRVFLVDYRLSTEAPFPAPFEDCHAALGWLRANAATLGVDATRIAVMGDSAGGCLAAAVAQRAQDEGTPVRAQILLYPVTDADCKTASAQDFSDTPLWNAKGSRVMWSLYLRGSPREPPPPYASPAHRANLAGLPAAYVETAEFDPLRDEGIDYAQRLESAGVRVILNATRGTIHAVDTVPHSPPTCAAMAARVAAVRELLGP
ncbi:MAG: alpha/beta hydrolase [Gammaproteobacteria bacterium]